MQNLVAHVCLIATLSLVVSGTSNPAMGIGNGGTNWIRSAPVSPMSIASSKSHRIDRFNDVLGSMKLKKKNSAIYNNDRGTTVDSDVVVIGAGLCGLTAAHECIKAGRSVGIYEAKPTFGGNIVSKKGSGFLWEEGPNSFQPTDAILKLCQELEILDEIAYADPSLPRYIIFANEMLQKYALTALPHSLKQFVSSTLFSLFGKLRLIQGMLGFINLPLNNNNAGGSRGKLNDHDDKQSINGFREETIEEFFTRHFGKELYERLVDPFISGVYAGDGRSLSISAAFPKIKQFDLYNQPIDNIHHQLNRSQSKEGQRVVRYSRSILESVIGSSLAGLLKKRPDTTSQATAGHEIPKPPAGSLCNFKNGMQVLTDALVSRIEKHPDLASVHAEHSCVRIHYDTEKELYQTVFRTASGELKTVSSREIILATPAFVAANIIDKSTRTSAVSAGRIDVSDVDSMRSARWRADEVRRRRSDAFNPSGMLRLFPEPMVSLLNSVVYCPVASVITAYPPELLRNDSSTNWLQAFGHLIPRSTLKLPSDCSTKGSRSPFTTLGTIWSSQLFSGRLEAPHENYVVFTSFLGGMQSVAKRQREKSIDEGERVRDEFKCESPDACGSGSSSSGGSVDGSAPKGAADSSRNVVSWSDSKLARTVHLELMQLLGRSPDVAAAAKLPQYLPDIASRLHSGVISPQPYVNREQSAKSVSGLSVRQPVLLGIKRWEKGIPQFEL